MSYHIMNGNVNRCWKKRKCVIQNSLHFSDANSAQHYLLAQQERSYQVNRLKSANDELSQTEKNHITFEFSPVSNKDMTIRDIRKQLDRFNALRSEGKVRQGNNVFRVKINHLVKTREDRRRVLGIDAMRSPLVNPNSMSIDSWWSFTVSGPNQFNLRSQFPSLHKVNFSPEAYKESAGKLKRFIREIVTYNRNHLSIPREPVFEKREDTIKREVEEMFSQFKIALGIIEEAEYGVWHTHTTYNRYKVGTFKDSTDNAIRSITDYRFSPLSKELISDFAKSAETVYRNRVDAEIFIKVSEKISSNTWWELIRDNNGWIINTVNNGNTMESTEFSSPEEAYRVIRQFAIAAGQSGLSVTRRANFVYEVSNATENALESFGIKRTISKLDNKDNDEANTLLPTVSMGSTEEIDNTNNIVQYMNSSAETQRMIANSLVSFSFSR